MLILFVIHWLNTKAKNKKKRNSLTKDEINNSCDSSLFIDFVQKKNPSYEIDEYQVTTPDGYILKLFRINLPEHAKQNLQDKSKTSKVMFLIHPFSTCSDCWFMCDTKRAMGSYFVNRGYDVWAFNQRGNKYSKGHVDKDIHPRDYYRYTMDEPATIDIPSCYEKIMEVTGKDQITLAGYSMGGLYITLA